MKILTIIGARPQFVKASVVSKVFSDHYQAKISEVVVHTGQHFDENMPAVFFQELGWNRVVPPVSIEQIITAAETPFQQNPNQTNPYGDGASSYKIASFLGS